MIVLKESYSEWTDRWDDGNTSKRHIIKKDHIIRIIYFPEDREMEVQTKIGTIYCTDVQERHFEIISEQLTQEKI